MASTETDLQFTIWPEYWADWSLQLATETDRGLAATAAAILDYLIASLIESFIIDDAKATKRLIVNTFSPLGTFASRIAAAYSLGLISKKERDDLDCIRDIRNDFAHQLKTASFSDPFIVQQVSSLKTPKLIPNEIGGKSTHTPRSLFIDAVSMLSTFIDIRTKNNHEKRTAPKDFTLLPTKDITIPGKKQP